MRHCVFCDEPLARGEPRTPDSRGRHAYDPFLGRLWEICPRCARWNPVPLELRWEALDAWEALVQARGRTLLRTEHLALIRVDEGEVVRVGDPPLAEWGAWRYGSRLPREQPPTGFLRRILGSLPPAPIEGYDPYGLTGPMGGVGGKAGPREWLASPFLDRAQPLTLGFASVPFAPECPSCRAPMPLNPWDFQQVTFRAVSERIGVEAPCAHCGTSVLLPLRETRAAIRMGLGIVDSGEEARRVGERAGAGLDRIGGGEALLRKLGRMGAPVGELGRTERVALGIALDREAEAEALEAEWKEAEEIAAIMDGELTHVPGFRAFRRRILGEL